MSGEFGWSNNDQNSKRRDHFATTTKRKEIINKTIRSLMISQINNRWKKGKLLQDFGRKFHEIRLHTHEDDHMRIMQDNHKDNQSQKENKQHN